MPIKPPKYLQQTANADILIGSLEMAAVDMEGNVIATYNAFASVHEGGFNMMSEGILETASSGHTYKGMRSGEIPASFDGKTVAITDALLVVESNAANAAVLQLLGDSALAFENAWDDSAELFDFLGSTNLMVWDELDEQWVIIDRLNYLDWLEISVFGQDSMRVEYAGAVPEPATLATIFGALALALAAYRRRK